MGFSGGSVVKNLCASAGDAGSIPGSEDPPEEEMATHSRIFLPGKSHGRRRLVGYSPWGRKELDTTEHLTDTHTHMIT